jgi:hypothetical protein
MTDSDERPIRVLLFGDQFAVLDNAEAMFSASGPNAVATGLHDRQRPNIHSFIRR